MKQMLRARQHRGVVLIVALVMMAVIGISSSIALKGALSQDMVAANQRSRSLAGQAAEAALRYCEASVTATNMSGEQVNIQRAPAVAAEETPFWAKADTWTSGSIYVVKVPATFKFDGSDANYNRPPECLIQTVSLGAMPSRDPKSPPPEAYIITSRGFSPDYAESGNNTPVAGAVVWLQSSIQIIP
jgi:Tfp pilus assembly protein PilX